MPRESSTQFYSYSRCSTVDPDARPHELLGFLLGVHSLDCGISRFKDNDGHDLEEGKPEHVEGKHEVVVRRMLWWSQIQD